MLDTGAGVPGVDTVAAPLQVRVGIATGLVVVGDLVGSGEAQERGVVGETPNLAARLQALAEPGTVVIAPSTRRLTGGLFEYEDLGAVELKGLGAPVMAARVLRGSAAESRFEALHGRDLNALVGRDEELALLQRRWQQAKAGEGRVVVLIGEPGIGKSRLAQAMLKEVAGEPHTRLRYFCSPHHQASALHPFITQLEHAAGFSREDTPEARLARLEALLARSNAGAEEIGFIAERMSIPTGDKYRLPDLTPQRRKEKTLEALLAQMARLAARQPVLMLFEDAHWIDPTSLELLILTVARASTLPLLLLITARPQFTPPWPAEAHVTMLALARLGRREGMTLVARSAGGKALPAEILEQILARTDGVPLFLDFASCERARSIARRYETSARSGALGVRRRSKSPISRWTSGSHTASLVRSQCTTAALSAISASSVFPRFSRHSANRTCNIQRPTRTPILRHSARALLKAAMRSSAHCPVTQASCQISNIEPTAQSCANPCSLATRGNCAPPPASPGSCATKASPPRRAICWRRSMAGSRRASTRSTSRRPRRCSTTWRELEIIVRRSPVRMSA